MSASGSSRAPTLEELAVSAVPHLEVVSVSQPTPVLRSNNLLILTTSEDVGRRAVLELESGEDDDAHIGTVVMSTPGARPITTDEAVDPEHVTGMVARRSLGGGLIGAIVGAAVIGVATWIFTGSPGTAAAVAVGGAIFGFIIAGTWSTFGRLGGSDAYRQTFVPPEIADLVIVSLHSSAPRLVDDARERLAALDDVTLIEVDEHGRRLGDDPATGARRRSRRR